MAAAVSATAARTTAAATLAALRQGRLHGATRLDLRGCGLRELPPEVLALAGTLQVLDVSDNALDALPPGFERLQGLHTLFCSSNAFCELPPVLGRLPALDIVGFKANRIERVAAEALPPRLRWLILTDNRIADLPARLWQCAQLQKLMLAGNRLRRLPEGVDACQRLELVRLAANRFEDAADALPPALLSLPRLAWLAHAGNPFGAAREAEAERAATLVTIDASALTLQSRLGEGASGVIHAAAWQRDGRAPEPVAVKRFKGAMTSDGLPRSEMAACLAAGDHPNLVGALGRLAAGAAHAPDAAQGLVLRRVPAGHAALAGPPSFETCTRDVYADGLRFGADEAVGLAEALSAALEHLHRRGIVHGDLYAHNTLVRLDGTGAAARASRLSDFGAASFVPAGDDARGEALKRLDRRALGWLVDELAARCDAPAALAPWQGDGRR